MRVKLAFYVISDMHGNNSEFHNEQLIPHYSAENINKLLSKNDDEYIFKIETNPNNFLIPKPINKYISYLKRKARVALENENPYKLETMKDKLTSDNFSFVTEDKLTGNLKQTNQLLIDHLKKLEQQFDDNQ